MVVDDHALFREGLVAILQAQPDFKVVGEAGEGMEALVKARELLPDLVLMDIRMPGMDGLEATRSIKNELPETRIVILTVRDEDEKLFDAIRAGAQGYLLKTVRAQELLKQLRAAVRGEPALTPQLASRMLQEFRRLSKWAAAFPTEEEPEVLTPREQEVLDLVVQGATNEEIAEMLSISIHTVKSHVRHILSKLHVSSRREAARYAQRKGLV